MEVRDCFGTKIYCLTQRGLRLFGYLWFRVFIQRSGKLELTLQVTDSPASLRLPGTSPHSEECKEADCQNGRSHQLRRRVAGVVPLAACGGGGGGGGDNHRRLAGDLHRAGVAHVRDRLGDGRVGVRHRDLLDRGLLFLSCLRTGEGHLEDGYERGGEPPSAKASRCIDLHKLDRHLRRIHSHCASKPVHHGILQHLVLGNHGGVVHCELHGNFNDSGDRCHRGRGLVGRVGRVGGGGDGASGGGR